MAAQQANDTPWAFWDFLPTVAELAGQRIPAGLDGLSIAPVLQGKALKPREYFYWEFHEGGFQQAVRKGNWKLVRQEGKPPELYDLSRDLSERNNIVEQHKDIAGSLAEIFAAAHRTQRS